jgi:type II secretory pathway pseudopilin PulG
MMNRSNRAVGADPRVRPLGSENQVGYGGPPLHRLHRNNAFALLELMFVLGLLAFVALVAGQLFFGITRATSQVNQRQAAQIRVDQAVRRLRQDVWNATQITVPDPQHLQIKLADKSVTWSAGQFLKRDTGAESQRWDELQTDLHFEQRGPTVSLAQEPTQGESGGRVTLLNANAVLKGPNP